MPSTQHTQACVFIKLTVQNWFFFLPPALEIVDQDENQVKNSVLKSRNWCDQVMRTKSFSRQNAPYDAIKRPVLSSGVYPNLHQKIFLPRPYFQSNNCLFHEVNSILVVILDESI